MAGYPKQTLEFKWTDEHKKAFNSKTLLMSTLALGYSNFSRQFNLETDASVQGLGDHSITKG